MHSVKFVHLRHVPQFDFIDMQYAFVRAIQFAKSVRRVNGTVNVPMRPDAVFLCFRTFVVAVIGVRLQRFHKLGTWTYRNTPRVKTCIFTQPEIRKSHRNMQSR